MFWNLERVIMISFGIVFLVIMYTVLYVFDKFEYIRKDKKIKPLKRGFKSLHKMNQRNGLYRWRKEHLNWIGKGNPVYPLSLGRNKRGEKTYEPGKDYFEEI